MSFLHFFFPITRTNCYNIFFSMCHPTDAIMLIQLSHKVNCIFWNFINTVFSIVTFFFSRTELLKRSFTTSHFFQGLESKTFFTPFAARLKPRTDGNPDPLLGDETMALFFVNKFFFIVSLSVYSPQFSSVFPPFGDH